MVRHFGWRVDLKGADVEVLLDISGVGVSVGVALTRVSKFKRNIVQFGPTTLRSTIAYGLLRSSIDDLNLWILLINPFLIMFPSSCLTPSTPHLTSSLLPGTLPPQAG